MFGPENEGARAPSGSPGSATYVQNALIVEDWVILCEEFTSPRPLCCGPLLSVEGQVRSVGMPRTAVAGSWSEDSLWFGDLGPC